MIKTSVVLVTTFLFTFVALGLFAGYVDDIVDPTQLNMIYIYIKFVIERKNLMIMFPTCKVINAEL